jgi:phosphatidylserine decarboxylase
MRIHREGTVSIILAAILLLSAILIPIEFPGLWWFKLLITLPFIVLFSLILWFFRIPKRNVVPDENIVYAPADGKIVVIEKTREDEYFKDDRIQVSIFMSPLNVHQNIYPVSGKVVYTKYHKGKYLVAWHPKSSILNERSTIVVHHESGKEILIRQIAGAVARRICTYSKTGEEVQQGNELGFIKFGSRVDLFLPLDANIQCHLNQNARNKLSVIAKLGV